MVNGLLINHSKDKGGIHSFKWTTPTLNYVPGKKNSDRDQTVVILRDQKRRCKSIIDILNKHIKDIDNRIIIEEKKNLPSLFDSEE